MVTESFFEQGFFSSDSEIKLVALENMPDWFEMTNLTNIHSNANPGVLRKAFTQWPYGFGAFGTQAIYNTNGAYTLEDRLHSDFEGFMKFDGTDLTPYPPVALTGGVDQPQVSFTTASTSYLNLGVIVRVEGTNLANFNGIDFKISLVTLNTSFRMYSSLPNAPGAAPNGGSYRIIAPDYQTYEKFYPSKRFVCGISRAEAGMAIIETTLDHGLNVGDVVRLNVPEVFGMTEIDGMTATVTEVFSSVQIYIDIDTTNFSVFVWPGIADAPFTHATYVPVGKDQTQENFTSSDATENKRNAYVRFGTMVAGAYGDLIYWRAGSNTLR